MKSQEEIVFENIVGRKVGGYCHSYPYKSLGNILNMLYAYDFNGCDVCTIGNNQVNYRGGVIATIEFNDELQIPIFTFNEEFMFLDFYQQNYLKMINTEYGIDYVKGIDEIYNKFKIK